MRNWHERKQSGASANVAETTEKDKTTTKTGATENATAVNLEDAIKKAIDERLAKVKNELGSMIAAAEAEPEPAPVEESFAGMLAKAIVNRK